ncbi:MAG: methyltransferase domain-containing protein [Legionellales bacterium]|nr:methyltransferase domain-containing protein [Legionellales bacterium]
MLVTTQSTKQAIANRFSRSAHRYDQAATVQRQVGQLLMKQLLGHCFGDKECILDLGGGSGFYVQQLARQFPQQSLIYLDIAASMSQFAKRQCQKHQALFLQADFDHIPLADHSVAQIFSNMTLQWSLDFMTTLTELKRIMTPTAQLNFSLPVAGTLWELDYSCQRDASYSCVNDFMSPSQVVEYLEQAGFVLQQELKQEVVYYYPDVVSLLRQLRDIGANSLTHTTSRYYGKQFMRELIQTYETFRCSQGLPVTYQIFYGAAQCKP